jgi:F-type H+-transporting ATPase subunit delta
LSAAHRIYARALFEAAQEEGKLETVHTELGQLRDAVASVDDLRLLLENPEVDSRVKGDVLARVAEGSDELVVNFLRLLAEKGRADEIPEMVAEFEALVAAEERILDVELTTAHELSDEEFGRILGRIEQASGRKVQAERHVNPDLIGGIVLQAGSMRLDASVRGRLERLRHDLTHARS